MKMKKEYLNAEIEIIEIKTEDIVCISDPKEDTLPEDGWSNGNG